MSADRETGGTWGAVASFPHTVVKVGEPLQMFLQIADCDSQNADVFNIRQSQAGAAFLAKTGFGPERTSNREQMLAGLRRVLSAPLAKTRKSLCCSQDQRQRRSIPLAA